MPATSAVTHTATHGVAASRLVAGLVALTLAVALAACGGSDASPTGSAAAPEVSLTPPPGGVDSGTLTVRAQNIAFDPAELHAPSGEVLVITLDNKDDGVPHDLRIDSGGRELGKTDIITGPMRAQVQVGPLEPGSYPFVCEVHPNMTGTLVVDP